MYFVRIGLLFFLYVRNIAFQISHIYSDKKVSSTLQLPCPSFEGTEKHTIFILTLIKKKKSIRVFMILVDFLLDKI